MTQLSTSTKGLLCQICGEPSKDHTYHQVTLTDKRDDKREYLIYLCTKCYKAGKANEFK